MNKVLQAEQKYDIMVSEKERKLIETLRSISFGQVIIFIQDSQPVRIEEIHKSTKL